MDKRFKTFENNKTQMGSKIYNRKNSFVNSFEIAIFSEYYNILINVYQISTEALYSFYNASIFLNLMKNKFILFSHNFHSSSNFNLSKNKFYHILQSFYSLAKLHSKIYSKHIKFYKNISILEKKAIFYYSLFENNFHFTDNFQNIIHFHRFMEILSLNNKYICNSSFNPYFSFYILDILLFSINNISIGNCSNYYPYPYPHYHYYYSNYHYYYYYYYYYSNYHYYYFYFYYFFFKNSFHSYQFINHEFNNRRDFEYF